MNSVSYFPDQRHLLAMTVIRRERLMPEGATAMVNAQEGDRVDLRDVVARGVVPSHYLILEAAQFFNLRRPQALDALLLVEEGDLVEKGQALAGKAGGRGKRLLSPVNGVVAYLGDGRIILQETPEQIELEAGLIGTVVGTRQGRGVVIETVGAVFQGVWGNQRLVVGTLRLEPEDGLENIYGDQIDVQYRGTVVVTRRPLRPTSFQVIRDQGLSGVIAPSMEAGLIDMAMDSSAAILLTEGFGALRMSQFVYKFLDGLKDRQVTLDAVRPEFDPLRRPEIIVNLPVRSGQRPPSPDAHLALRVGMNVHLTRGEHAGLVGQIVELPRQPLTLANGLRVPCAHVQLVTGERADVPLANLEVFGQ